MSAPFILPASSQWINVQGTPGTFLAPGSNVKVSYIMTYASLSDAGSSNSILTHQLLPVREFYDIGELNFDEILQRDIDDYRVATSIIPYLLNQGVKARFFPPILAVVAPHEHGSGSKYYPDSTVEHKNEGNYKSKIIRYGSCFEVTDYYDTEGQRAMSASLRFNPEQAKLVVIDGQHRAMALLAIKRSKTNQWGDKGRDYKYFYEDLASELKNRDILTQLNQIELPVCICYFPDLTERGTATADDVKKVCRKIFLDVNKQAKKPSKARTLLLDDSNLISGLTRDVLQHVKNHHGQRSAKNISIDSFEYDSPKDAPVPKRDLAICSVEMLYQLIYWSSFAKDEYYTNIKAKQTGRLSDPQYTRFFTDIRIDDNVTTRQIQQWGYNDLSIDFQINDVTPKAMAYLSSEYSKGWGAAILQIFDNLHPFKAHVNAVNQLRAKHKVETGKAALAYRALFEGQGLFWTLEQYSIAQRNNRAIDPSIPESDIEEAYSITQEWIKKQFKPYRVKEYWGKTQLDEETQTKSAEESFNVFRTQAFTIGVLMAFAYLKHKGKLTYTDLPEATNSWINAWNTGFSPDNTRHDKALRSFDRTDQDSIFSKHFGSLKPTDWYWFRYFSFEIMVSSEIDFPAKECAIEAINHNRSQFIHNLGLRIFKNKQSIGEIISEKDAIDLAKNLWRSALKHSLGIRTGDFDEWYRKNNGNSDQIKSYNDDDDSNSSSMNDEHEN